MVSMASLGSDLGPQSTPVLLHLLPALESARPKHSSPSGANPTAQAGGETEKMSRELSSLSLL